jgi:hypothetical protein
VTSSPIITVSPILRVRISTLGILHIPCGYTAVSNVQDSYGRRLRWQRA